MPRSEPLVPLGGSTRSPTPHSNGCSERNTGEAGIHAIDLSELHTAGFLVVPGPVPASELPILAAAYDEAFAGADVADSRQGSTTVRVGGFVNRAACFDPIYVCGSLLRAAARIIGAPFKLSAFHGRSVRPFAEAQPLHRDFPPLSNGWPMIGFIFMVDDFLVENGATRFVPGSQSQCELPAHPDEIHACGPAGSMVIYNGSVWHGHGANRTDKPRRSIQGALIRADQAGAVDHCNNTREDVARRLSPTARVLLGLEAR